MSKRTIEPVRIVLPVSEGGYYRFGDLPRLIADALYPEQAEADEHEQEMQWMRHTFDCCEHVPRDLRRAAGLPEDAPGYLHVVENSASKRPLEWREGAVLDSGLVHLDWLNDWGQSRNPPWIFSTAAPPQDEAPMGKRWTEQALSELASYRAKHGTGKAAVHFGISEARIRELLPSEKKKPSKATTFSGLVHRMK